MYPILKIENTQLELKLSMRIFLHRILLTNLRVLWMRFTGRLMKLVRGENRNHCFSFF